MVVDKSDLVLVRASVMEPRADSVVITMHGKLDLGVAIPVKVSPMKLNLFVQGVENNAPYVTLDLPEATITGNKSVGVVNQYRRLENMDAWLAYVHDVVYLKEGILSVEGTSVSHIGALSSHVKLVKHLHEPSEPPPFSDRSAACIHTSLTAAFAQCSTSSRASPSSSPSCSFPQDRTASTWWPTRPSRIPQFSNCR